MIVPRVVAVLATSMMVVTACSSGDGKASPGTTAAARDDATEIFFSGYKSDVYSRDEHWLCRPGLAFQPVHPRPRRHGRFCRRISHARAVRAGDQARVRLLLRVPDGPVRRRGKRAVRRKLRPGDLHGAHAGGPFRDEVRGVRAAVPPTHPDRARQLRRRLRQDRVHRRARRVPLLPREPQPGAPLRAHGPFAGRRPSATADLRPDRPEPQAARSDDLGSAAREPGGCTRGEGRGWLVQERPRLSRRVRCRVRDLLLVVPFDGTAAVRLVLRGGRASRVNGRCAPIRPSSTAARACWCPTSTWR